MKNYSNSLQQPFLSKCKFFIPNGASNLRKDKSILKEFSVLKYHLRFFGLCFMYIVFKIWLLEVYRPEEFCEKSVTVFNLLFLLSFEHCLYTYYKVLF